jgi:hypothetical protein
MAFFEQPPALATGRLHNDEELKSVLLPKLPAMRPNEHYVNPAQTTILKCD